MKNRINLLFVFVFSASAFGQVGVNTTTPTSALDVNGDMRVRDVKTLNTTPSYVLAPDENGVISKYNYPSVSAAGATPTSVVKQEYVNSENQTVKSINAKAYTTIPNSTMEVNIPEGGRPTSINFLCNIYIDGAAYNQQTTPNSQLGSGYYKFRMFVDDAETSMVVVLKTDGSNNVNTSVPISTVLNLSAGKHVILFKVIAQPDSLPSDFDNTYDYATMFSEYMNISYLP